MWIEFGVDEWRLPYLLALQQSVEEEACIGLLVTRQRVELLHAPCVGCTGLSHIGIGEVVVGPIRGSPSILPTDVRGRRMGQVVVYWKGKVR